MFQFPGFAFHCWNNHCWLGCPIRTPADQFLFADPSSFSQLTTSFFAFESLGIPHTPFLTSIISQLTFVMWLRATYRITYTSQCFVQIFTYCARLIILSDFTVQQNIKIVIS